MASVFSHPAVPLALAVALGRSRVPPALALAGCAASVLPDVDSVGFWAGIPYGDLLGHRGLTHSLPFAMLVAAIGAPFARRLGSSPLFASVFLFASAASHGLLDALTAGGLGVAFFGPFTGRRYFLPWRVLEVSPIGPAAFLSGWGLRVLGSEIAWVWAPCALAAAAGAALRRIRRSPQCPGGSPHGG